MLYAAYYMTDKMLKFVKLEQQNPPKREVLQRKEDFNEIYREFINEKAKEQSSRCSQCGVPFCQVHCPLHNNIPDWLKLTAEGRLQEASELAHSTNNMPEVCGRICPQDRLCEGNCVIEQSGHGTVTIGSIDKRFMPLPKEVLINTLRTHQKYLMTEYTDKKLASFFVIVSSVMTNDSLEKVIKGNEKVTLSNRKPPTSGKGKQSLSLCSSKPYSFKFMK